MQHDRADLWQQANAILKADNDNNPPARKPRIRNRSTRPAWNWLRKQDERAAAALWLVARRMLPVADNDNSPSDAKGMGLERRKDGKPRGKNAAPMSLESYLALPSVQPRLGDAEYVAGRLQGWGSWYEVKPQRQVFDFHPDCRHGFCAPAIAYGASFMGAQSGLGQPKAGKQRGDARRVEEPDLPAMPDRIFVIIEAMLARADLAGIGRALGYGGGYADRMGGKAMREAGRWALGVVSA